MSQLVDNERRKLLANALDRASTACFTVGIATPVAGYLYNIGNFATAVSGWRLAFGLLGSGSTVSNPKLARYYLRSVESAHKGEKESWYNPNEDALAITLEHVLPINPEENWPNFTPDEIKIYAKRMGNLVLLQAKTNSDLKSDAFSVKREILKASPTAQLRWLVMSPSGHRN